MGNLGKNKIDLLKIMLLLISLIIMEGAEAAFTFTAYDTQGRLLNFSNPSRILGSGISNGDGQAYQGDKYKYTNVITINNTQINAIVTIVEIVNARLDYFDDNSPNPTPKDPSRSQTINGIVYYKTSFGQSVPETAIWAPRITAIDRTKNAYVKFQVDFKDIQDKPVVLKNVYNNTLDDESVEYNEYGGFVSYRFSGDNKTNTTQRMVASPGQNGNIKFSNTNCLGNSGLYITDSSRVQTKFDTITSLTIINGQFPTNAAVVPNGNGGFTQCNNTSTRAYGAIFVQDDFMDIPGTPIEFVAPTVNLLTTSDTTPNVTGTVGGEIGRFPPYSSDVYDLNGISNFGQDSITIKQQVVIGGGALVSNGNIEVGASAQIKADTLTPTTYLFPAGNYNQSFSEQVVYGTAPSNNWQYVDAPLKQSVNASQWNARQIAPLTIPSLSGSCPSMTVMDDQVQELSPGCYGDIVVRNRATVKLKGGTYVFNKFEVIQNAVATVQFDVASASFQGYVKSALTLDSQLTFKDVDGNAPPPNRIRWYANQSTDLIFGGHDSKIYGHIIAPNAKVIVDLRTILGGTIKAKSLELRENATICTPASEESYRQDLTAGSCPVVSAAVQKGSSLITGDTFSVILNGVTYNQGDPNLMIKDINWTLAVPTPLAVGTYDVVAKRNNILVDQTTNELVITPICTLPQVLNATGTGCVTPTQTDTLLCHSGDGLNYTKLVVPSTGVTNHETHAFDVQADANGNCPITPVVCVPPQIRDVATNTCINLTCTPPNVLNATGDACVVNLTPPTVNVQSTYDTTPVITGKVGNLPLNSSETFTVLVNNVTYTAGDGYLGVANLDWTLTIPVGKEIPSRVQPYDVTASRGALVDPTSGELTIKVCALPTVLNANGDVCISPLPTVESQTLNVNTVVSPVLKGTVGEVALGALETFSVTIKANVPQTYSKGDAALVISGVNWILTVPAAKALSAGTYDIDVTRNATAKDTTVNELIINLVCNTGQVAVNGACVSTATLPTVDSLITDDPTPAITGTVGGSPLGGGESFSVQVNGKVYANTSELTIVNKNWMLTIPQSASLNPGVYDVLATRNPGSNNPTTDTTTNELTIQPCLSPKMIKNTGECALPNLVPTVNKTNADISASQIMVTGTVGDTVLGQNEVFSVKISNSAHSNVAGSLLTQGINWTFQLSERWPGIYEVDALRNTMHDATHNELEITNNIDICENGVDKAIPKENWNGAREGTGYYLGKCTSSPSAEPLPQSPDDKNAVLPDEPLPTKYENPVPLPPQITYCDDGQSIKSSSSEEQPATGVAIKRATIINAATQGGTIDLLTMPAKIQFGKKISGIGTMDITNATIIKGNKAINVTLTGVTLDDVYIDTATDFIDANGNLIGNNSTTYIKVTGGTTKPFTQKEDGSTTYATIVSGIITAGTDSGGNPVRGSVTTGRFKSDINNTNTVMVKGRRVRGKLVGAIIENATTTTVNGVTVVDAGNIKAGQLEAGSTSPVSTFGTVYNATITNGELYKAYSCSSSGNVGSRGQLNWKEVVH